MKDGCLTVDAVHFSSQRDNWETPPEVFKPLDAEFAFTLDPCATEDNAKCSKFYTVADNGLAQSWAGEVVFVNPPYGRQVGQWVKKAWEEAEAGAVVVLLLPARTDTAWWHDYCMKGEVRFIRGRIKFVGGQSSAPFPSAVVIFRAGRW